MRDKQNALQKIRSVADYQLGKGTGKALFPDKVKIVLSRNTGRIRHIYLGNDLLATLRPTDGMFSLTLTGAKRLMRGVKPPRLWVKVQKDVEPFIAQGKSVFAKHVVDADDEIRPQEEVIIIGANNRVLAVGKAVLTGREMKAFKHGVAVKVRRGASEEVKNI
jgi:7-cyano-7-deazaguanine tRNA-ribosyltransferase